MGGDANCAALGARTEQRALRPAKYLDVIDVEHVGNGGGNGRVGVSGLERRVVHIDCGGVGTESGHTAAGILRDAANREPVGVADRAEINARRNTGDVTERLDVPRIQIALAERRDADGDAADVFFTPLCGNDHFLECRSRRCVGFSGNCIAVRDDGPQSEANCTRQAQICAVHLSSPRWNSCLDLMSGCGVPSSGTPVVNNSTTQTIKASARSWWIRACRSSVDVHINVYCAFPRQPSAWCSPSHSAWFVSHSVDLDRALQNLDSSVPICKILSWPMESTFAIRKRSGRIGTGNWEPFRNVNIEPEKQRNSGRISVAEVP